MSTLGELTAPYRSVSFIGMCKNAGKTTAFNQVVRELRAQRVPVAVTSVGRDGESTDLVTNTAKPGIYVYAGTVVATAAELLKYCDITKEILETTGISTPLGEIVLLRAKSDGFVQLAGPSVTTQLAALSGTFRKYGAEKILIDGALGRRSLCAKKVSESTILCTGASCHRDMRRVVRDTAFTCELLQLPRTEYMLSDGFWEQDRCKYLPVREDGQICIPDEKRTPEMLWRRGQADPPKAVAVQGGLTDAMVRGLLMSGADLRGKKMILRDGSRILLSHGVYEKLKIRGLNFEVADALRLLAVTVNPFSAYGFHFDRTEFAERMREAVDVPVYDVIADAGS